jgi:putative ABC transport system permease protein
MGWKQKIRGWLRAFFQQDDVDREMSEEMRLHVDMQIQENLQSGMEPEEARRAALRDFGWTESIKQTCQEERDLVWLDHLAMDLRFGARLLRKNPGFAAVVVLTLALGLGANCAIFTVVNGVLLRPLPYPEADRLVTICESNPRQGWSQYVTSIGAYADWRRQSASFEEVAAATVLGPMTAPGLTDTKLVHVGAVSASFFTLLGVHPIMGRHFIREEENPDRGDVVVLSEALWRQRFGADLAILNHTIRLGDRNFTVVGVMPSNLRLFDPAGVQGWDNGFPKCDLWRPLPVESGLRKQRNYRAFLVLARLKRGVSLGQAQAEMTNIAQQEAKEYPNSNSGWSVSIQPWRSTVVRNARLPLLLLFAAVGLVLLIATANLANLYLARAVLRQREFAVRIAVGAARARLARQCFTESVLLGCLGGSLGLLIAHWSISLFKGMIPADVPRLEEVRLDGNVICFTVAASLLASLLFALIPMSTFWRGDFNTPLKVGARGSSSHTGRPNLRSWLVTAQVAVVVVLLAGAGLLTRSASNLAKVDPGFHPSHLLALDVSLAGQAYTNQARRIQFVEQGLSRLSELSGVESFSAVDGLPLDTGRGGMDIALTSVQGMAPPGPGETWTARLSLTGPEYLQAMGISLSQGRAFSRGDDMKAAPVVVINEALAHRYFPGTDPIGKQLGSPDLGPQPCRIVGVVRDIRQSSLDAPARPEVFRPLLQECFSSVTFVVRTHSAPGRIFEAIRRTLGNIDRSVAVYNSRNIEEAIFDSLAPRRLALGLIGSFAALALVLALLGIYGVLSCVVNESTNEIGIRLAIGASRWEVLRLMLMRGMRWVGVGGVLGLAGACALTRYLQSYLYNLSPTDPFTLGLVCFLVAVVSLLACWLPARRAAKVDPMVALRCE